MVCTRTMNKEKISLIKSIIMSFLINTSYEIKNKLNCLILINHLKTLYFLEKLKTNKFKY